MSSGVDLCCCSSTSTGAVDSSKPGRVDLHLLLRKLGDLGCNEVLVEAGPTLVGAFLSAGLWDELLIYTAPKFLGSHAQPTAVLPLHNMSEAIEAKIASVDLLGTDLRTRLVRLDNDLAGLDVVPLGCPA
jgi:diaminohydroxyphosphoribosylaminopyrimidine deaminase/5-amino-6-(5-phosphoribosylamino)uracil reductase